MKAHWQNKPIWNDFQKSIEWLCDRERQHTSWLDDLSKYVNVRFDSRTGACLIQHDINKHNKYLKIEG